ncbi:MAG: transposase [Chromatiaceae bacterium]
MQLALRDIFSDQLVARLRELLRLILLKFGPPSPAVYRLVSAADAETLLRWSERILTAESADALLN